MDLYKEPIPNTCNDIDIMSCNLQEVYEWVNNLHASSIDSIFDEIDEIKSKIAFITKYNIENIRTANSTLRQWGCSLVELVEERDKQILALEDEVDNLKDLLQEKLE